MPESKLCPMQFQLSGGSKQCHGSKCAWWVTPYTVEGFKMSGMCAIEMIAMKTNQGQYRV